MIAATQEMVEWIGEEYPKLLNADGFEDAILGVVSGCGRSDAVCYDYERCLEILMERDGMDRESALEFMEFNVTAAYVGKYTPFFLFRP